MVRVRASQRLILVVGLAITSPLQSEFSQHIRTNNVALFASLDHDNNHGEISSNPWRRGGPGPKNARSHARQPLAQVLCKSASYDLVTERNSAVINVASAIEQS